jgi:hypothetical protein
MGAVPVVPGALHANSHPSRLVSIQCTAIIWPRFILSLFRPQGWNPEICGLKHPQKSRHHSPSLVSLTLRRGNFLTVWISLSPTRPLFFGPGIWVNRTWCFVNNSSRRARAKFLRPFNSDRIRERHVNRDKSHIALSQRVRSGGAQPHKRNSTRCHFYSPLAILLRVELNRGVSWSGTAIFCVETRIFSFASLQLVKFFVTLVHIHLWNGKYVF